MVEGPLPGVYSVGRYLGGYREGSKSCDAGDTLLSETPEQKSQAESKIADLENKFQTAMKPYEKTIRDPHRARELFENLGPSAGAVQRKSGKPSCR